MMTTVKLLAWGATDVGRKREHNEDSLLLDCALGVFAVADGMGGHLGGDRASRMAVDVVRGELERAQQLGFPINPPSPRAGEPGFPVGGDTIPSMPAYGEEFLSTLPPTEALPAPELAACDLSPPAIALRDAARTASNAIYDAAQIDAHFQGMGTTLTAMLAHKERAYLAHVGDSRAYLYRDGRVQQLTEDHSWIAEQVKAGLLTDAEARDSRWKHIITRSVGVEPDVRVDVQQLPLMLGDCYIICSDGLSNYVGPEEMGHLLLASFYRRVPQLLVELANDRGGDDNITVLLVYVANEK